MVHVLNEVRVLVPLSPLLRYDHGRIEIFNITASCLTDQTLYASSFPSIPNRFACRPLFDKVYSHISPGCIVEAAVEHTETDRRSRSHDLFYKDYIREKNDGVIVPRRSRKATPLLSAESI